MIQHVLEWIWHNFYFSVEYPAAEESSSTKQTWLPASKRAKDEGGMKDVGMTGCNDCHQSWDSAASHRRVSWQDLNRTFSYFGVCHSWPEGGSGEEENEILLLFCGPRNNQWKERGVLRCPSFTSGGLVYNNRTKKWQQEPEKILFKDPF